LILKSLNHSIEYIKGIRLIGLKSSINETKIVSYDHNSIEIYISKKDGVEIYILETTAKKRIEVDILLVLLRVKSPNLIISHYPRLTIIQLIFKKVSNIKIFQIFLF